MSIKRQDYQQDYYQTNKEKLQAYKHAWYLKNKVKVLERRRVWDKEHPKEAQQYYRRGMLKWRYKITPEEFEVLAKEQENKCAICKQEAKLNVDHDHKTGKVRGLLCSTCNHGLGNFKDSIEIMRAAIKYLENHLTVS